MAKVQADERGSVISGSSVAAAGLASALAAAVTSRFGVAGSLVGAALTTMIITGASSILNAYLQSAADKAKAAPGNLRSAARRRKPRIQGDWIPDQPGLRNNFMGRLRAAVNWFSDLPGSRRRSIIKRGLIGTVAAFVVGLVAITAVEAGIGSTLSCAIWQRGCVTTAPATGYGAVPQEQASGGTSLGRVFGGGGASQQQVVPGQQGTPGQQGAPAQQDGGGWFGGGQSEQPGQPVPQPTPVEPEQPLPQQPAPQQPVPQQPAPQEPAPQQPAPQEPVPQEPVPQQPAPPDG